MTQLIISSEFFPWNTCPVCSSRLISFQREERTTETFVEGIKRGPYVSECVEYECQCLYIQCSDQPLRLIKQCSRAQEFALKLRGDNQEHKGAIQAEVPFEKAPEKVPFEKAPESSETKDQQLTGWLASIDTGDAPEPSEEEDGY